MSGLTATLDRPDGDYAPGEVATLTVNYDDTVRPTVDIGIDISIGAVSVDDLTFHVAAPIVVQAAGIEFTQVSDDRTAKVAVYTAVMPDEPTS